MAAELLDEPHPSPDTPLDLVRGFALGVAGGSRTLLPLALLARQVSSEGPDIADGGWFLDLFAHRRTAIVLGLGGLAEMVGDKRAAAMARVSPVPLVGRIITGGTAGAVQALSEGRRSDHGAVVGTAGAVVGSLALYWLRTRLPGPRLLLAFGEDVLAIVLGLWAVHH